VSLRDLAAQRGRFDATDEAFDAALAALEALAMRWDVDAEPALLGEPTCSLAVAGMARGERVVLKVPILGEERTTGYRAARAFAGHGGVDVLEGDDATGALLMRRLEGPDLSTLPDDAATDVWIDLFQRMRGATGDGMPLADYVVLPKVPLRGVTLGEHASILARRASLLASAPAPRLLHGDLHHFNVLAHAGAWYAIDPKGLSGDLHFEAAALLRNPFESLLAANDIVSLLSRRIDRIARATGLDAGRLRDWGVVQTCGCARSGSARWRRAMLKVVLGLMAG
jgi:streptomycin 6-kinase